MKLPIFVALDLDNEKQALALAEKVSPYVFGFKVGPRLYLSSSSSLIHHLSQLGKVFLDFKFLDIPSTMSASVQACFKMGVDYLTVHASAGLQTLAQLARVEKDYQGRILAVTVLTSQKTIDGIKPDDLESSKDSLMWEKMDKNQNSLNQSLLLKRVLNLAQTVYESGLRGLVSSPYEVKMLREKYSDFFIVTPGIRLPVEFSDNKEGKETPIQSVKNEDQSRTADPAYALQQGASALVIGRPILQAQDPVKVLKNIAGSLKKQESRTK